MKPKEQMAHYCNKCGNQTMLMIGTVILEPDDEPYESGKEEEPRTDIDIVEKRIMAQFCEKCDEVIETSNE